jgi:hypothetical protein
VISCGTVWFGLVHLLQYLCSLSFSTFLKQIVDTCCVFDFLNHWLNTTQT